jgi:hypothetical protein
LCRSERTGLANDEIETAQALPQTTRHQGAGRRCVRGLAQGMRRCADCLSRLEACLRCRAALAFEAYEAALDREEVAAEVYAALMRRGGHLVEPGLARQLASLPSIPGAPA